MSKNIDLRKEYVRLVQQEGKETSLFKLKEIWELKLLVQISSKHFIVEDM
jgi:3-dehydroquinate synthase class II